MYAGADVTIAMEEPCDRCGKPYTNNSCAEFTGHAHDDPRLFLSACEEKLTRHNTAPEDWTERVSGQLRGEARTWWSQAGGYDVGWDDFSRRLEARFNDARTQNKCRSELFSRAQESGESEEAFVFGKLRLYRRLSLGGRADDVLPFIVELVSPELRPFLRGVVSHGLENFLARARDIEYDLMVHRRTKNIATPRPTPQTQEAVQPEDAQAVVPYIE
ncbi:activity-regulated cytoskeleton-associated protein-like [Bacillus rossius redtenbacheri]|uniref:activity-regulated cytoskeleton-associated protein-like n=1 Tax=Bacillus rossius redtenbacheri TaxID=93214 RepID=UPI002FDE1BE1